MIGQDRIDKTTSRWLRKEHRPGEVFDQKGGKLGQKTSYTTEKTLQQQLDELKLQNILKARKFFCVGTRLLRRAGDNQQKVNAHVKYKIIHQMYLQAKNQITIKTMSNIHSRKLPLWILLMVKSEGNTHQKRKSG